MHISSYCYPVDTGEAAQTPVEATGFLGLSPDSVDLQYHRESYRAAAHQIELSQPTTY